MRPRNKALLLLWMANVVAGLVQIRHLPKLWESPRTVAGPYRLVAFGSTCTSSGQPFILRAQVTDQSGDPVKGVVVEFGREGFMPRASAATDSEGFAEVSIAGESGLHGQLSYRLRDHPNVEVTRPVWSDSEVMAFDLRRSRLDWWTGKRFPHSHRFLCTESPDLTLELMAEEVAIGAPIRFTVVSESEFLWLDLINPKGIVVVTKRLTGDRETEVVPPTGYQGELTLLVYELKRGGAFDAATVRVGPYVGIDVDKTSTEIIAIGQDASDGDLEFGMIVAPSSLNHLRRHFIPSASELTPETSRWITAEQVKHHGGISGKTLILIAKLLWGLSLCAWFSLIAMKAAKQDWEQDAEEGTSTDGFSPAVQVSIGLVALAPALVCTRWRLYCFVAVTVVVAVWVLCRKVATPLFRAAFATALILTTWCLTIFLLGMGRVPVPERATSPLYVFGWWPVALIVCWPFLCMTFRDLRQRKRLLGWCLALFFVGSAPFWGPHVSNRASKAVPADYPYSQNAYATLWPLLGDKFAISDLLERHRWEHELTVDSFGAPLEGWKTIPESSDLQVRVYATDGKDRVVKQIPLGTE